MTFDEWYKDNWMYVDHLENAKVIWNAALSVSREAAAVVPLKEITTLLDEAMSRAVANGADSRSMPDEYVAIAHFTCYPEKYGYALPPVASGQKLTAEEVIAALPKECTKVYGDYERGYNKALGHAAEKLRALLRATDSATASDKDKT